MKPAHPLFAKHHRCRCTELQSFADAWVGMEPTFTKRKVVRKWAKLSGRAGGEDAYFEDPWMLAKMRAVGRTLRKRYRQALAHGDPACLFPEVELEFDRDPWDVERVNLRFHSGARRDEVFEVRFGIDPETFEYSVKPVPLAWFHDERFVRFLQVFLWDVPQSRGLAPAMAHGGGQFSFSAKTWLQGSLLADDIASRLDHPELATWISDYPNCDGRSFRATRRRFDAFRRVVDQYWSGAFHPKATGVPRVENALFDTGFQAAANPAPGTMDPRMGPRGDEDAVFQTNFTFGRVVRREAQAVQPGYWQSQHPDEDGYRSDQIMRYSESNLNRLQIAGELHVKSGKVLDVDDVPDLDAPLELAMLYDEASWEIRSQMSRSDAEDFVEAVLLDAHHAEWLLHHPHVSVRASLAQDVLLMDAHATLRKLDPGRLSELEKAARRENLVASRQRIKSDFVEPETLFWATWTVLPGGQRAEIAREAIHGFVERVENAATKDPRGKWSDPMEPHRHRIHPLLWEALEGDAGAASADTVVARELRAWRADQTRYLARRPIWSPSGDAPPWQAD